MKLFFSLLNRSHRPGFDDWQFTGSAFPPEHHFLVDVAQLQSDPHHTHRDSMPHSLNCKLGYESSRSNFRQPMLFKDTTTGCFIIQTSHALGTLALTASLRFKYSSFITFNDMLRIVAMTLIKWLNLLKIKTFKLIIYPKFKQNRVLSDHRQCD